jgi:hypothetical protein
MKDIDYTNTISLLETETKKSEDKYKDKEKKYDDASQKRHDTYKTLVNASRYLLREYRAYNKKVEKIDEKIDDYNNATTNMENAKRRFAERVLRKQIANFVSATAEYTNDASRDTTQSELNESAQTFALKKIGEEFIDLLDSFNVVVKSQYRGCYQEILRGYIEEDLELGELKGYNIIDNYEFNKDNERNNTVTRFYKFVVSPMPPEELKERLDRYEGMFDCDNYERGTENNESYKISNVISVNEKTVDSYKSIPEHIKSILKKEVIEVRKHNWIIRELFPPQFGN